MKRRHRVNRELLLPTQGRAPRRGLKPGLAIAATLALAGALTIPIVAQGVEERQGNIPVAIDSINDPSFFTGDVQVHPDAPLAVFGASGKKVAIDGRPLSMLEGAAEEETESTNGNSALLAGQVGELGVLPGELQLMHPVNTRRISSAYGWRKNPTGPGNQIHIGQDYALACGSPVYAAEAGRVVVSGWHGHSGNRVTVDHGNNVQTGYSHNTKLLVKIGQEVQQGELIALVGTTGNSTGCHLHFEVIIDGRWHDPRIYLPRIPGQPEAMVDSRRLTVKSYTAPEGKDPQESSRPRPSQDPDVVTPEDDTPIVPDSTPSPSPTKSESPSPSPTPAPTEDESKSPSPEPSSPDPTSPEPTESESSPTPEESSPTPTEEESSAEPSAPQQESPSPEGTPQGSPTPSQDPSPSGGSGESESASPNTVEESQDPASPQPSATTPTAEPSSSAQPVSPEPLETLSPTSATPLPTVSPRITGS